MKLIMTLALFLLTSLAIASSQNNFVNTIPIHFEYHLPYVDTSINGHNYKLLLDTGSAHTFIALNQKVSSKLRLTKLDLLEQSHLNACNQKLPPTYIIKIPQFGLGNFTYRNLQGYEYVIAPGCGSNPNTLGHMLDVGLIGISLINRTNFIIDYPNNQFVMFAHELPAKYTNKKWWTIPLTHPAEDGIYTAGEIDGQTIEILWDTGTNMSTIKTAWLKNKGVKCDKSASNNNDCDLVTVDGFKIGGHSFDKLNFFHHEQFKLPFDMSIGYNFFHDHVVMINFEKMTLSVEDKP